MSRKEIALLTALTTSIVALIVTKRRHNKDLNVLFAMLHRRDGQIRDLQHPTEPKESAELEVDKAAHEFYQELNEDDYA